MDLFDKFSSKENLKKAFEYIVKEADTTSLPSDPFLIPSINAIKELGSPYFETLEKLLRANKYKPDKASYLYAQKDNSDLRPIAILTATDKIIFQALLNPDILGNKIDKKLYSFCLGHRIIGNNYFLHPYKKQWNKFCDGQIDSFKNKNVWRIEFDISSYYESILIETLISTLKKEFQIKEAPLLEILENQLRAWAENPQFQGSIPQGSEASNVLANAYLHPLDSFVANTDGNDFDYFRYVDDVVIMAKNSNRIHEIVEEITLFLRCYHLKLNEKTKLEKLNNTKKIEEVRFYSHYGEMNESSKEKINKIKRKVPFIINKIKRGKELDKADAGALRYFLKAGAEIDDANIIDKLISIIPNKPSFVFFISRYLSYSFYSSGESIDTVVRARYKKVWEMYLKNSLTKWTKFWIFKILTASDLSIEHEEFQNEINKIVFSKENPFLKIVALFYKIYAKNDGALGYNLDNIKTFIREAKSESEKAIYYYLSIYLINDNNKEEITELVYDALNSISSEIQLIGIFITKKIGIAVEKKIDGEFSKLYFQQPLIEGRNDFKKELPASDVINFQGTISKQELSRIIGSIQPNKLQRNNNLRKVKSPLLKETKAEIEIDKLASFNDGTIRYNGKIIQLRNQIKDLCRLFMEYSERVITIDDIKESIVRADKRKTTPNSTISKYVSELHNALRIHFKKEVIFNQKEEGWYIKVK